MKNSNDIIGNRKSDFSGCSTVPQPIGPGRTPFSVRYELYIYILEGPR